MCGIAGAFSFEGKDVGAILKKMLMILAYRGPDGSGYVTERSVYFGESPFILRLIRGTMGIGHNRLAMTGKGNQPIPNENKTIWVSHNGEIYNYLNIKNILRQHNFTTNIDSEAIVHVYEEDRISLLDGDFAVLVLDLNKEELIAFRDLMGIRPLFYCVNREKVLFASERKALMNFCDRYERVKPGEIIIVSHDGISHEFWGDLEDFMDFNKQEIISWSENEILRYLEETLYEIVDKISYQAYSIFFSGGIDSTLIAKISSDLGHDFALITVGTNNSLDIQNARNAAKIIGATHLVKELNINEILNVAGLIPRIIDELDPLKVMIGLPIFIAAKVARENGFKVAVTGQGADELFGGYKKYLLGDVMALEAELISDIKNIYHKNLERDDHCSMANSVEIRPPYLDRKIVTFGLALPVNMKVKDGIRKYVLRKLALRLGIPKQIAFREKKAVQYGTRVSYILKKVARKNKKTMEELLRWLMLNV